MSYPRQPEVGMAIGIGRGRGRARVRADYPGTATPPPRPPGEDNPASREVETIGQLSLAEKPCAPVAGKTWPADVKTAGAVSEAESVPERGAHRGTRLEGPDIFSEQFRSRPEGLATKQGTSGNGMKLVANYFGLRCSPDWALFQYRVDFSPAEDVLEVRKAIVRGQRAVLGAYIFDGTLLYKSSPLSEENCTVLPCINKKDSTNVDVQLRLVGKVHPGDPVYTQFYNLIVRKCLYGLELEEMGRHFYDRHAAITVNQHRLQLWPGYVTSMRAHEREVLLCVELTHKVLRMDNVLTVLKSLKSSRNFEEAAEAELKGAIVMTHYNRKTYRVDDIDFSGNPMTTFEQGGKAVTYADYYRSRYNLEITDMQQPLLLSRPSNKQLHRGHTNNILLIPELCQLTGLTDQMRANFSLMKDLAQHLHMAPHAKTRAITDFMARIQNTPKVMEEIGQWGIGFDKNLIECQGRVLPRESILFHEGTSELANDKADWTMAFRSKKLLNPTRLDKWIMFVPQRDASSTDNLIRTMMKVSGPLNFQIRQPMEVVKLNDTRIPTYLRAIDSAEQSGNNYQMMFVILPNNKLDLYSAVKKRLSVDLGIPSQCMLAKNASSKGLMSIATKMTIQMCTKLGGEPWSIKLPLKNLMVVGFDVYSGGKGSGFSIGATVASTSASLASYFSVTSNHVNNEELSRNLNFDLKKCCNAYQSKNGVLPDRIILFRDGVGDGQLGYVRSLEVQQVQDALVQLYGDAGKEPPKLTFIVVTKKINTRFFSGGDRKDNPPPGTVVDDVVTLPERYDFFLVAQTARQGTVSPTSFHVMHDTQGLTADRIQIISYKMCHLYFNWSGTVAVPAPCQYAHKLAFLTGMSLSKHAHHSLAHNLHFL